MGAEITLVLERLALFEAEIRVLEASMVEALGAVPEAGVRRLTWVSTTSGRDHCELHQAREHFPFARPA